jgi:S-formylglutathione hydrolase
MIIKRYRSHVLSITPVLLIALVCMNSVEAQQGKVIYDTIHSPSLEGNLLKDPSTKPMTIYLPPSYDEGDSLYPVIYYLHGYTADNTMWVNWFSIHNIMDNLIKQGKVQEMIIVMPDAYNKYGGSFYTNSSVAGKYEDYMTSDIIEFIDGKYRTLPQRESRGIGGGSMGGYGAMKLAMKHPDIYSAVVSHSGLLSLEHRKNLICSNPNYILNGYPAHRAMAIAWSPNPDDPLLYDYPADDRGNLVEEVWQKWLGHDPLTMVEAYHSTREDQTILLT